MRTARLILSALLPIAAIFAPSAFGQTTPDLEEGMKPYGDFHGGDIDQVSLSSGKLVLNIPLVSYPQRGGRIKVGFGLRWQNITPRQRETYYSNTDTYVEVTNRDANSASVGQLDFVDDLGWSASGGCMYGETVTEPVAPGTNLKAVSNPDVDILAHPGLITPEVADIAKSNNVLLEISGRKTHALANGHVARVIERARATPIVDSDAHAPEDLLTQDKAILIARASGLPDPQVQIATETAQDILLKRLGLI